MRRLLPKFEHRTQPVLSTQKFLFRLVRSGLIAFVLIAVSLFIGMAGYHLIVDLDWIDAFLNAAMLLGGMGPVNTPVSSGGKLFAGIYALYCGLVVILVTGIMLAPIAHRILHRFHVDERNQ